MAKQIIIDKNGKKVGGNVEAIFEPSRHSFYPGKYILDDQGTRFYFSQGFSLKRVKND